MVSSKWSSIIRATGVLGIACAAGGFVPAASAAWTEDFSAVPDATPLGSLSGWNKVMGLDTYVTTASGLTNQGIAFPSNGGGANNYTKSLTAAESVTSADTGIGFSFAFKVDSISFTEYRLEFGDSDNSASNHFSLGISSGSLYVGSSVLGTFAKDTWYKIDVTNIALSPALQGDQVSATLAMYALDSSGNVVSTAINPVSITGVGSSGQPFDEINYVSLISPWYTGGHTLSLDNFALTSGAVPEPASIGVLACGALFLLRRKR